MSVSLICYVLQKNMNYRLLQISSKTSPSSIIICYIIISYKTFHKTCSILQSDLIHLMLKKISINNINRIPRDHWLLEKCNQNKFLNYLHHHFQNSYSMQDWKDISSYKTVFFAPINVQKSFF